MGNMMKFHRLAPPLLMATLFAAPGFAADPPKLSVATTISAPDGGWDKASVNEATRQLYVGRSDGVLAVDLDSGKVTPRFVAGKGLHSVLPLADGKAISTNGSDNTATLFDSATGKVIASIAIGLDPDTALFEPVSGLVLVMDGHDGEITLIDAKTGTSPGKIPVGGKLAGAATDGHGLAYINVQDRNAQNGPEIAVVDIAQHKVTAHYPLTSCERPMGLALNPATGLLVAACANRTALAVHAKDGTIAATLAIGERADAVLFDPARKLFFVSCGEGNLAVIGEGGGAPAVIGTIPTANGARTAALDPKTGKLYLPTADFSAPAQGEKRHKVVPGTFRILVVGEK
jgi:DNA-binding beta-propeller fold protein YncE